MSCALAKLRMAVWARTFTSSLKGSGCKLWMAKGYVDDLRFWIENLELVTRWAGGGEGGTPDTLVWRLEWEEEDLREGVSRERVTARELLKKMNNIAGDIKMTVEICEDFASNTMPALDTQMEVKLHKEGGRSFL